jgi:hypothetical protein
MRMAAVRDHRLTRELSQHDGQWRMGQGFLWLSLAIDPNPGEIDWLLEILTPGQMVQRGSGQGTSSRGRRGGSSDIGSAERNDWHCPPDIWWQMGSCGGELAGTGSSGTARTQVGGIGRAQSRGNWRTMGCGSITKMAGGALAEHVGGARGKGRGWNMGPRRTDGGSRMANEQAMDRQAWAMTAALGHGWAAAKAR